ncbi:UNVERIFIED_CONTAM: DNA topoisomerase 6 subunit B [Sesamum radiatum]|uniref:DNA topoisomerase 6 subunit B n=1 Tax=Sesamum radiatum TaxID=300843 RepID=A0AAW2W5N2_SESRA
MEIGGSSESPPDTKKSKSKTPRKSKDAQLLKQKSPAEFFADNKNIAGFDNPGKCLYTTVRELVENALDSAESISELPVIEITIEEIGRSKFNSMIGLADHERVDAELYDDFETAKAREKRLAKEARLQEIQAKNAALGKKAKAPTAMKSIKSREASYYRVTCKDNGRGMPHDDIPNMFGRVLSGTKYGLKQTRGKFGLGAKMSKILHYMRQMAVITPYAQFLFKFLSESPDKNVTVRFARRTDVMPPAPLETKYHPSAVDLLLIKRLITETSKQNLLQFLQHEFVNVGKSYAERLIGEMGPDFGPKMPVKSLTSQQIVRIHQLFRQAKFDDPSGDCLSPAGEYNLRLGIIKELHPDMVATYSGSAQVFEGHPFIVEAGLSLGGKDVKQGLNIFRFANRIPLLFEQGADVVTRTAVKRINWNSYKINQTQDKIGVFVSIVSTKIPFKGTGKEYIGDDISEIASAVKTAIQQCCVQLKSKIVKRIQAREQQERKRSLNKYIPNATGAIYEILKEMSRSHASKKRRSEDKDAELLKQVSDQIVTEETLREKLAQHVEQVDYEMALEYATQTGVNEEPREDIYIPPLQAEYNFTEFHSPVFVFRLVH